LIPTCREILIAARRQRSVPANRSAPRQHRRWKSRRIRRRTCCKVIVEDPRVGKSNVATVDRIVAGSTVGPRSRCHGGFDHSKRTRSSVNDTYGRMGSRRTEQVIVTLQRDQSDDAKAVWHGSHKVNKSDLPRIRDMSCLDNCLDACYGLLQPALLPWSASSRALSPCCARHRLFMYLNSSLLFIAFIQKLPIEAKSIHDRWPGAGSMAAVSQMRHTQSQQLATYFTGSQAGSQIS
jgi:hypothetical protein